MKRLVVYKLLPKDAAIRTDLPGAEGKRVLQLRKFRYASVTPRSEPFALIGRWRAVYGPQAGDILALEEHPERGGLRIFAVFEVWRASDNRGLSVEVVVERLRDAGFDAVPFRPSDYGVRDD